MPVGAAKERERIDESLLSPARGPGEGQLARQKMFRWHLLWSTPLTAAKAKEEAKTPILLGEPHSPAKEAEQEPACAPITEALETTWGLRHLLPVRKRPRHLPAGMDSPLPDGNQAVRWGAWTLTSPGRSEATALQCQRKPAERGGLNKTLSYNTMYEYTVFN